MEAKSIQTQVRKARQQRRVGPDAACILCGNTNPEQLRRMRRSLLECHHVVGRANDDALTVTVCLNHHAQLNEDQCTQGVPLQNPGSFLERLEAVLRSLTAFFERLAAASRQWADQLLAFIQGLDVRCPTWRTMPEAV